MKIAVWHNLPSGGGKRALYDHVGGLLERGHTVESWCPPTADQTYLPLSDLVEEHVVPLRWGPKIAKNRFGQIINPYRSVAHMLEAMDKHCQECAKEINLGGFDLLFANSCAFIQVSPIGRYVNIPKVLYLQEPCRYLYEARRQEPYRCLSDRDGSPHLPWIALPRSGTSWFVKNLRRFPRDFMQMQAWRLQAREEWLGAKAFDVILVNSYFSRESVLRTYGLNAQVCYLGIDTNRFINEHQTRENFVVGLGQITSHKNIEFVIQALARVRVQGLRLIWIGNVANEGYLQYLKEYASDLGVNFEARVGITDVELVSLLNRAAMMVYASRLEPFGFAPLEANACGTPVAAVAEGGIRETVVDGFNGLLVEGDSQAMARAIESLMSDPAYARQLGDNGSKLVSERWSLPAAIDRLERRFADVVATRLPAG